MDFSLPGAGKFLHCSHIIPPHLSRYSIPFAQACYKKFTNGEMIAQVILGSDYSIWTYSFLMIGRQMFNARTDVDILALSYMLDGNADCLLNGFGPLYLQEDTYRLVFVPAKKTNKMRLEEGVYRFVNINFHPSKLQTIAKQYPVFHPMLEQAEQKMKKGMTLEHSFISTYMRNLIQEILHCDFGVAEREFFIESRIRDLLRFYVRDRGSIPENALLSGRQKKILQVVQNYISANLDKDLTTDKLAAIAGVARSWLHKLFIRHYMKPIHRLVMELRLEEAARLLVTTDLPISTIHIRTTTGTFSHFCVSFRRRYNMPPSRYRRNHEQKQKK